MIKKLVFSPLEPWQEDVYNEVHNARGSGKIFVVKSRRQVGKSTLAAILLIEFAVKQKCVSVVVEPTQNQSRRMYKQITDMLSTSGLIVSANSQLLTIELWNGSEILFKSAEQGDALRGFTVSGLLVIDEASFIQDNIFEILFPTVDANSAPMLVISTPLFQSGEFYSLYTRGTNGEENIKSFNWSTYDTSKFLPPEKLEYYRRTLSELKFKSEYLGEFISEGSYIFGQFGRCIHYKDYDKPVVAGIDWGNGGGDYTVMTLMNASGNVTKIYAWNDIAPVEQIEKLANIINSLHLSKVCVETNSIGEVYYDMLRRKIKTPIRRFNTNNQSKRDIIEKLVTAFQKESITIPNDAELIRELQHYAMEKTTKGYTYNGADGVNDDYVISLALAYDTYNNSGSIDVAFV